MKLLPIIALLSCVAVLASAADSAKPPRRYYMVAADVTGTDGSGKYIVKTVIRFDSTTGEAHLLAPLTTNSVHWIPIAEPKSHSIISPPSIAPDADYRNWTDAQIVRELKLIGDALFWGEAHPKGGDLETPSGTIKLSASELRSLLAHYNIERDGLLAEQKRRLK